VSGLAFLLIALAISVLGSLLLWVRTRRPSSLDSGIDAFQREMQALSPYPVPQGRQAPGPRPAERGGRAAAGRGRRRPG